MPGVIVSEEEEGEKRMASITNGNNKGENHRKSKSDDSASFLRAARGGNSEKVLEYLKNGTDINTCNANGLNALHLASKEGHVHIVQDLLARGAKIDAATKKGNTALHIASLAGQEEVVKILVAHSASVNVQSQNGFTPLYMAAQENHDGVVRFLLASGASQSLATEDGFTPLAVALQQGHNKVVAVLLENDTRGKVRLPALHIAAKKDDTKAAALLLQNEHNPDVTSKSGFTPLHIASHYGNENIAAVLLQRGADVNYSAKHNITPLHVAAKWGKSNMVSLLLDKGANLESRTRDGLTPLHCAARSGHENVVDMMLQRSAPISAKTKNGLAPLHMASQGDHVDAARILLHHKAPVDEVTVDYLTALHVAAHCGHVRVAKLLLDRKGDPNSRALNGFTPLHIACKKNRIKVVELLLKFGASIEATTESGLTPLHVASFMGCMNIVIYLIQHQASPDEATVRGETPLHLAARANQTDIIRILLRNGAKVDARAREQQTPLHIASRLGNVDIVVLLLQSGAQVDAVTKDLYTALHIAAKEGQEEVAAILLEHSASMTATTKKGFTPLHLAAKYGNHKVARQLLSKESPVDAEGKNGVTPLHVAVHYDNTKLAMLLLEKGASPHAAAKNGYTPLHISAKKNQMEIANTLVEYGAKVGAESKAGFTPLHLAGQEGHQEMAALLIKQEAEVNCKAKNGLTPLHLCAQEDRVEVAKILVDGGAECDSETRAGYTPLHVAAHFGQVNMVRFLLQQGVKVDSQNELGYSPLHQAAQQGHTQIVNLLLEAGASPNSMSNSGQTPLSIAQKLGYISVVETLKVVTDEVVTTTTTITTEEKYRVLAPESMQETFMSDSEDEGGEENIQDHSYKYLTTEEMKGLGDDSMQIDVTNDEKEKKDSMNRTAEASIEKKILEMERSRDYTNIKMEDYSNDAVDNVELPVRPPVSAGFLVSFMVDARGGAMRGCRHSGVRVIIPPRKAPMPMRVTCRYLKKDKLVHPPPLNEGEALASRILELGPAKAQFLGPVIIEVPHFASLRGKEREIVILRSDNGEKWTEHSLEATEEAVQEVLQESFDGEDTAPLEDLNTNRITRILTTDFPQYFAIITRIRQELHAIGPDGGLVNSSVVPQVQAMFPQGALTKKIKVGLQAQPIPPELTAKLLGNRVAVSPIVTVEPRRRKFHKPITLTIPVPVAAGKGMINQYSGDTPTLRLLCSITGGTTRAQWEDVTGSTPLTFLNDCVSFTTTVSARFWLMDCRHVAEATKMATTLYKEAIHVPFMAKFVVFSKRHEQLEARVRVFCMTDDKEEKTLENQEHFHEIAKSRDVEVLEGKTHHLEFFGNLHPVTKSGDQLSHKFHAFRENRLPFTVRVKDPNNEASGRVSFFREPKQNKGEVQQTPLCNLNLSLPSDLSPEASYTDKDLLAIQAKYSFLREAGYGKFDTIHRADLRVSDISNLLGKDWIKVARELGVEEQDINLIMTEYPDNVGQQAMVMLRLWLNTEGNHATGNALEKALQRCDRQDIVNKCMINMAEVTDDEEMTLAQSQLQHADQSQQLHHADDGVEEVGFNDFKAGLTELGPSKNSTLKRDYSMDVAHEDFEITEETSRLENISEERMTAHTVTEHRLEETSRMAETTMMVEESSSRVVEESSRMVEEISLTTKSERLEEEATAVYEREEQKYVAEEKALTASFTEQEEKLTATTTTTTTSRMEEEEEERRIEEEIVVEEQQQQVEKKMSLLSSSKQMFEGSTVEESMSRQEQVVTESTATFQEERKVVVEEETFVAERTNGSAYTEMARTEDTRREEEEEEVVKEVVTGTETSLAEAGDLVDTEKKEVVDEAKGLKGLKESLEDSFEIVKPDSPTEGPSDTTHLVQAQHSSSFSEEEEEEVMESEPESPKSPSPKVSPGSKSPSPAQKSSASSSSDEADEQRHSSSDSEEDEDDLKKATEQELLDEMIVKDVPEASTDPVKKFEETQTTSGSSTIDCIEEDAEDSQLECKDPLNDVKPPFVEPTSATTTSSTNLSNFPFNIDSNFPISHDSLSSEMPSKEEEQDKSPTLSGLAAPDSKDSLEVQMYSVCEDISDTMSGREESVEDIKLRDDSCDLGEEEQLDSVSGKELEIAEIKHEFEVIEECEFDEARKIACEVKEEAVQEIHMETRDQNLVSNTEVKQQMSEVMNIFEKIETESNDKKDEVDDVKVERQTVSTVVEQIEKQVEIQDECVVKTAYKTTSFESSDYSETSDKESSFKKISTTIQEQVEIKDKCDVKTFYKTTSEESSDYSELSDAKDMKRHPMPIQESTDESETAERKSEDEATVTGCLKVVIVEAADLVNQDMVGKSDPYAILSYQGKDYRSETVNESLTPVWNFEVDLDIEDINTDITIKIFDDDYGRDNFEGGLILAVDSLVKSKESRSWYNLTDCKSGRVLVSTLFSQGVVVQSDEAKTDANVEVVTKERQRVSSTSSSASSEHDDGVKTETRTEVGQVAHHSSDSSLSTRQESTVKKLHTQDTVDENDSLSSDAQKERKDATSGGGEDSSSSSDDSSDTEEEGKRGGGGGGGGGAASSSDYDSSNRATRPPTLGGKRPDSFVSDTSSDYDSASNPGSRRPQSFVLDDEYDVITEEEAAESTKHDTKHEYTSSESESEGPAVVGKKKSTALPPIQGDQEGGEELE